MKGAAAPGQDCCGDRYPCVATVACKCGCQRAYCSACYRGHCVDLVERLQGELAEVRQGYHDLDCNWDRVHSTAMGAIRGALEMPDASVPELCARIQQLKAGAS